MYSEMIPRTGSKVKHNTSTMITDWVQIQTILELIAIDSCNIQQFGDCETVGSNPTTNKIDCFVSWKYIFQMFLQRIYLQFN